MSRASRELAVRLVSSRTPAELEDEIENLVIRLDHAESRASTLAVELKALRESPLPVESIRSLSVALADCETVNSLLAYTRELERTLDAAWTRIRVLWKAEARRPELRVVRAYKSDVKVKCSKCRRPTLWRTIGGAAQCHPACPTKTIQTETHRVVLDAVWKIISDEEVD